MKHQLIKLSPLSRCTSPVKGFPAIRDGDPAKWSPPEGYAYVPIVAHPSFDGDTQTADRVLTNTEDGWAVRDLTAEELAARNAIAPVKPLQFRLALIDAGISPASVDAMLSGDEAALAQWQYADEIHRDHPLVAAAAAQLNKTDEEIDAVFLNAATK